MGSFPNQHRTMQFKLCWIKGRTYCPCHMQGRTWDRLGVSRGGGGVERGGEHAVCEEEGGKAAADLQSHDPRQAIGLEGPSEWFAKGLPTFIILIFM